MRGGVIRNLYAPQRLYVGSTLVTDPIEVRRVREATLSETECVVLPSPNRSVLRLRTPSSVQTRGPLGVNQFPLWSPNQEGDRPNRAKEGRNGGTKSLRRCVSTRISYLFWVPTTPVSLIYRSGASYDLLTHWRLIRLVDTRPTGHGQFSVRGRGEDGRGP